LNLRTFEITVEDPSEAFDDMRDINDLGFLRTLPEFVKHRIDTNIPLRSFRKSLDWEALEKVRLTSKISPRQFYRVLEMHLLSLIPTSIRQSLLLQRPSKPLEDSKASKEPHFLNSHNQELVRMLIYFIGKDEYRKWQLIVKTRLYRHNKVALMQIDKPERVEKLTQALGTVEADYGRLLRAHDERNSKSPANGASSGKRSSPDDEDEEDEDDAEPPAKKVKFT